MWGFSLPPLLLQGVWNATFESIQGSMSQETRDQVMERKAPRDHVHGTNIQRLHLSCSHWRFHSLTNNQNKNITDSRVLLTVHFSSFSSSQTQILHRFLITSPAETTERIVPAAGGEEGIGCCCCCRLNFIVVGKEEHGVEKVQHRMCGHWYRGDV